MRVIVDFLLFTDTPNVPKTDLDQHRDDDTIDARLRAKHDLRKSIHEHTANDVDDRQESEEDCTNDAFALTTRMYWGLVLFRYQSIECTTRKWV